LFSREEITANDFVVNIEEKRCKVNTRS